MTRRTPSLLLLLIVLVSGVLYFANTETALDLESNDAAPPVELGTSASTRTKDEVALPPADPAPAIAEESASPEPTTTSRQSVTAETGPSAFTIPDDAIWVEGRVLLPEDTPFEERITVIARGRRFGDDRDNPREHRVTVERNGRFRVAFSEDTSKGWLDLEALYLYLPERLKIEPREQQGTLDLEPRLGGRIRGRALLPLGVPDEPASFADCRASVWAWSNDDTIRRGVDMEADGTFTVDALPVADNYQVMIESPRFAGGNLTEQFVKRGEELEVELQFLRGAHISGRVQDSAGEPVTQAKLEMKITQTEEGAMHSQIDQIALDAEGRFDEAGLDPGTIVLTLQATGFMELVHDLGAVEDGDELLDINLYPEVGKSLSGFVRWQDGTPVAEANVRVQQASPTGDFDWEARDFHVETDDDGAFLIEGLADRPIVVEASGRLPSEAASKGARKRRGTKVLQRLEDVQPGTAGLVVLLSEGTALTGKVTNDLGEAVERFQIEIEPLREGYDQYRRWDERTERGFRDEVGEFSITGLAPGRYRARANARDGGASIWKDFELPGAAPLEFVTPRGVTLTGIVRSARGEAVAGAKVELQYEVTGGQDPWMQDDSATERTSELGEFRFEGVAPGSLYLTAEAEGWSPSAAKPWLAEAGSSYTDLDLVLRNPSRLTGEVHPNAGPIADRRIVCYSNNYHDLTSSDAAGRFEFEGVPSGWIYVQLHPPSQLEGTDENELASMVDRERFELLEGEERHVVLGAPPTEPIRVAGRVTLAGEPAAGFAITARRSQFDVSAMTDSAGHFEFIVDGAGDYTFALVKDESQFNIGKTLTSEAEQRVDIEVPGASLAGIVTGPHGQPAANQSVIVVLQHAANEQRHAKFRQTDTNDLGRFRVEYLFPGEYTLHVATNDYFSHTTATFGMRVVDGIKLEAGQHLDDLRIELEEPSTFTAVVTTPQGTPVAGATILVTDSSGKTLSPWGLGQTDSAGRLECTGMPSGKLNVRVVLPTGEEASQSVRCAPGAPQEVRITL